MGKKDSESGEIKQKAKKTNGPTALIVKVYEESDSFISDCGLVPFKERLKKEKEGGVVDLIEEYVVFRVVNLQKKL